MEKYVAIIKSPVPNKLLPEGIMVEEFEITQSDIEEFLEDSEDGENELDAIEYFKNDYRDGWAQRLCSVQLIPFDKAKILLDGISKILSSSPQEEPFFDNEEEEEEENEWKGWE